MNKLHCKHCTVEFKPVIESQTCCSAFCAERRGYWNELAQVRRELARIYNIAQLKSMEND